MLLVRIDNRVGEALLTHPCCERRWRAAGASTVDLLVHPSAARVLEGHPPAERVIALDRRRCFWGPLAPGIRALRRERYDVVVDCANWTAPSVTAALVARLARPRAVVLGPRGRRSRLLHDVPVRPARQRHEVAQTPAPALAAGSGARRRAALLPGARGVRGHATLVADVGGTAIAVVNPGGRLGWRRVPPAVFAAAARALSRRGRRLMVTWGPGRKRWRRGAAAAPGRLAPRDRLDELAALMAGARLTVCNNTGPMHLSVAVGAPTLALFLRCDMARWGHDPTGCWT